MRRLSAITEDVGTVGPAADSGERLREIYRAEFPYVLRTLRRLGASPADAEDLAHDVFVIVHRRLDDYDSGRPLRPWLFGIAYRVAAGHRRLVRHGLEVPLAAGGEHAAACSAGAAPDERAAAVERLERLLRALDGIELAQRAVLVLHDIDGVAAPEIARVLDVNLNTVYSRLRLGREKLAEALKRLAAHEEAA